MDNQIGAPMERLAEIRCRQSIVDDQRYTGVLGNGGDGFQINDHAARIGQDFDEDRLAFRRQGLAEVLRVGGIDKIAMPTQTLKADAELGD